MFEYKYEMFEKVRTQNMLEMYLQLDKGLRVT